MRCDIAELRQCRHDVGNAPGLAGTVGAEPVQHRLSRHAVVVENEAARCFAGVLPQHVVFDRVAGGIEDNAVHGVFGKQAEVGRADLVSLDEPQIELDRLRAPKFLLGTTTVKQFKFGMTTSAEGSMSLCRLSWDP